jgi:hypothetical protein
MVSHGKQPDLRPDYRALYRHAFAAYGAAALWNKKLLDDPSPEHALVIARALRIEGDSGARRLAEEIEQAAKEALSAAV